MLGRDDDGRAALVQQTFDFLDCNAKLAERTAHVMNTEADVRGVLKRIEKEEGVDLTAAQFHHRNSRGTTVVELDGRQVAFPSRPVRTGVAGAEEKEKRLMLVRSRGMHTDFRAVLEDAPGDMLGHGFNGVRPVDCRIDSLEPWKRVVFDGARHLSLPVNVSYKSVTSTLSLRVRRAEVQRVLNWDELLDQVVAVLVERQTARRKRRRPE